MLENSGFPQKDAEEMYDEMGKKLPIGRIASPKEIAISIQFLASDLSSFTTGSNMFVDGGQVAANLSV